MFDIKSGEFQPTSYITPVRRFYDPLLNIHTVRFHAPNFQLLQFMLQFSDKIMQEVQKIARQGESEFPLELLSEATWPGIPSTSLDSYWFLFLFFFF